MLSLPVTGSRAGGFAIDTRTLAAGVAGTVIPTTLLGVLPAAAQIPVTVDLDPDGGTPGGPTAGPSPAPSGPSPSPRPTEEPAPGEPETPLPAPSPAPGEPESPAATPTVGLPTSPDPAPLPRTGADAGLLLVLALLCVLLGAVVIGALPPRRTR